MIARLVPSIGLALGAWTALVLPTLATERPVRPHLCPEDAPDGVRLPPQPGCGSREVATPSRDTGFREIVPGTGIRVGGRASSTFDARR